MEIKPTKFGVVCSGLFAYFFLWAIFFANYKTEEEARGHLYLALSFLAVGLVMEITVQIRRLRDSGSTTAQLR